MESAKFGDWLSVDALDPPVPIPLSTSTDLFTSKFSQLEIFLTFQCSYIAPHHACGSESESEFESESEHI